MKNIFTLVFLLSVFCTNSFAQFSNGGLDTIFDPGTGANSYVYSIVPLSNGKVMIGGLFSSFNSTAKSGICRLNKNGSIDATFGGTGISSGHRVYFIHPISNTKYLIAGTFTSYNGVAKNRIVKVNSNGTVDNTFNPGTGANGDIYMITAQPDGKFILVGSFTSYNGTPRNRIARINANGSLDALFDPGTGANSQVFVAKVQADGKILIGGNFTTFNNQSRNRVTRLNEDGSLDPSFNVGTGCNAFCTAISIQSDNQILLGGSFTGYNNVWRSNIARINQDGSLDESFVSIPGANYMIDYIIPLSNGKMMAAGQFTSYNNVTKHGVIRLQSNGDLDTTFNPGGSMQTGSNNSNYASLVYCMALGTGGDLWLAGNFTNYNGVSRNRVAHLSVVPHTQLTATYCNTTQQLNTNMAATAVSGATQYEWEVTNAEDDTVYMVTTANNRLRLNLISEATYDKIYSIRVRAFVGEWGEFASACNVTTPPIPASGLSPSLCGITMTSLSQNLTPITVVNATQYEWEITDVTTEVVTAKAVTKNLNLNTAAIPQYGYDKTYSIRIRAFIGGTSTWGPFGSACSVTTPAIPASGLIASQCGITMTTLSQTLSPITVLNATQYEWEITDVATTVVTNSTVTKTIKLSAAGIPGYGNNKTYSIRVRAFAGAWGPFGTACNINTPSTMGRMAVANEIEPKSTVIESTVSERMEVYPNPSNGLFHVRFTAALEIMVTDMMGHEIIRTVMEDNELPVDLTRFPNGVYLVKTGMKTVKVVKF